MTSRRNAWFHIIALVIVVVWGTTFVSTKVLLMHGLQPHEILLYRFALAYAGLWFVGRRRFMSASLGDEAKMALLGITGGSLYFMAENVALEYTLASNVSLILCTAPLLTAIATHLFSRNERLGRRTVAGSVVAFAGVGLVVFNGNYILQLDPIGDVLCTAAAMCWACYTVILKGLSERYDSLFITRKVFFWGLVTILPVFIWRPLAADMAVLRSPVVWGNLLYLGIAASLLCFLGWNIVVRKLGAIAPTNYLYFAPPVTLLTSALVIDERITPVAVAGAAMIISGVVYAEKRR